MRTICFVLHHVHVPMNLDNISYLNVFFGFYYEIDILRTQIHI